MCCLNASSSPLSPLTVTLAWNIAVISDSVELTRPVARDRFHYRWHYRIAEAMESKPLSPQSLRSAALRNVRIIKDTAKNAGP